MKSVLFLIGAIFFICIAHYVRVIRWKLFIEIYEHPQKRSLIQSLSVGYLLNYFVPYKLGDLVRAWMAGSKMSNGKSLALSSVIVDRYLDIISVGVIFILLSIGRNNSSVIVESVMFYVAAAIVLILVSAAVYLFRGILKKGIKLVAGIFNSRIETTILHFVWALIWNFKDMFQKINKGKLILSTCAMWLFYLMSYFLYGNFLNNLGSSISWVDVFVNLFAENGIKSSTFAIPLLGNSVLSAHPYYMILYMVSPLVIMLVLSAFMPNEVSKSAENHLKLLPQLDPKERLAFLESYFSDTNRDYVINYLKINQDISVIRDYSAGSNATTMLCMDGEKSFFRKYAFGDDGEKLYQQVQWIEENADILPLPEILKQKKEKLYCYYDMPYCSSSVGLFEYVHSAPLEKSWDMIRRVLETLERTTYQSKVRPCDRETIHKYVSSKVEKNLERIKADKRIRNLLQYEKIIINGVEYNNLPYYEKFLSEEYLQNIFGQDNYAVIHGDLTIENIICQRDQNGNDDFYIIDPNTGNVHDSPNLDYGKLLQSIHGGYEFLMATRNVSAADNRIDFLFTKSSAYIELHKLLREYMQDSLGVERTRSIYFHEIIHWLRLMPYKIEKDGKRALLFYAGMLIVMNDVIGMYGKVEENNRYAYKN